MKTLFRSLLVACFAFGANIAAAIPLQVNVSTLALGGSAGEWRLTGVTDAQDSWAHLFADSDSWNLDIDPGTYKWSITGLGVGLAGVSWSLVLDNVTVFSGKGAGLGIFKISDKAKFEVVPVPEPATLTLLGLGLGVIGFATRRRSRVAVSSS